jgi:NadR type nicotinamide-nucleotide adenylyltransferase
MTLGKDPAILEGIESEFVGHGLVFGKFMPPTNGHLHFIEFARQSCRKLTIVVCSLPEEPIPGDVRYKWMKELFPDCNVVHHYDKIAQEPKATPQDPTGAEDIKFFETWRDSLHKHCPGEKFDALFASEDYGFRMADIMGIKFIPVDIRRELVPISGTEMRNNPLRHWDHLHPVIRPYFVKRIAIVGPESAGKSTLAEKLGEHFNTTYVGEYGRSYLAECERQMPGYIANNMNIKDISTIARGQMASEYSLARQANRLLFCDTELRTTEYWSKFYFNGQCPQWVSKLAEERKYDLYLLVDPRGVEQHYKPDAQRPMPNLADRIALFDWWKAELDKRKAPYAVIGGDDWEKRFQNAVVAVYQNVPEMITAHTPASQFKKASNNPK